LPRLALSPLILSLANWRAHFGVWAVVAGVAFLALLVAAPPVPAGGVALTALDPAVSAPWLALAPTLARFPLGDGAAHVRMLSLLAGAITIALLLWRATDQRLVPRDSGRAARAPLGALEMLAAVFGVLAVVLPRAFFQAATCAGPAATGVLLAVGLLAVAEHVIRAPARARPGPGLALALVAGAVAGGPVAAGAIGWPPAIFALARAWRRRARWLRSALVVGGLTTVASLVVLVHGPGAARWGTVGARWLLLPLIRSLAQLSPAALGSAAGELADQIGVVALLVAAVGLPRLRAVTIFFTLWPLVGGLLVRAAAGAGAEGAVGLIAALASLAAPIGAGFARLSERLGRAALPAVGAIGVITVTWPLLAR